MTDQPNFETRVTEAEERALEAIRELREEFDSLNLLLGDKDDFAGLVRVKWAMGNVAEAAKLIATAAAVTRDYARKEG